MTEDKMIEWYQRLNGREFEQALGYGEGQGSLVCLGLQRAGCDLVTEQEQ